MIQIFSWIWAFSGVLLILLVLLHSPKGDGMGGIAASGSSMFNSASSAEASLNKVTWTFLVIFLSLAIILSAGWISWNWYKKGSLKNDPYISSVNFLDNCLVNSQSHHPYLGLQLEKMTLSSQVNLQQCIQW